MSLVLFVSECLVALSFATGLVSKRWFLVLMRLSLDFGVMVEDFFEKFCVVVSFYIGRVMLKLAECLFCVLFFCVFVDFGVFYI